MIVSRKQTEPSVLKRLAHFLGTEVINGRLTIPPGFGEGYCAGFVFNDHIRMMILNYELKQDLIITDPDTPAPGKTILFKFQNIFPKTENLPAGKDVRPTPSVLVVAGGVDPGAAISIHSNSAVVNIEVDADYLNGLFYGADKSAVLQGLLNNKQPLLFDQMIYPSLQKVVDEMLAGTVNQSFELFFLRVKAEELVCRLLMELEKRDEKQLRTLNIRDIETIYKVKDRILLHLDTPPLIRDLAAFSGMSPSKLKGLFKQIFGNSIFSYYQEFRMKEAARLLKEEKLSVSQVGYQMGFSNLSHFSKVFQDHIGIKPKQYSRP